MGVAIPKVGLYIIRAAQLVFSILALAAYGATQGGPAANSGDLAASETSSIAYALVISILAVVWVIMMLAGLFKSPGLGSTGDFLFCFLTISAASATASIVTLIDDINGIGCDNYSDDDFCTLLSVGSAFELLLSITFVPLVMQYLLSVSQDDITSEV